MKNYIWFKKIALTLLLAGIITGCSSHKPKPISIRLSDGPTIAYAYMKDGETLLRVQKSYSTPEEDIEVILIKKDGFYPYYDLNSLQEDGKTFGCPLPYSKKDTEDATDKCHSYYTEHTIGHALAMTGFLVVGIAGDLRSFDKDYFFEVIDKNNLVDEQ